MNNAPLESAVIVPVPEAESYVHRHRFRYDSVALRGVPAHITVLFPFVRPDELTEEITRSMRDVLAGFSAFTFSLARLERFPEGAVYLAPDPPEPFVGLTRAFAERFPEYPPYGGAYPDVIPHLTIAQIPPAPSENFGEISRHLPIWCLAREVTLMVEDEDHRWRTRSRFSFGNGSEP